MSPRSLLGLSFAGFIALGMPEGALGVAWPSISERFDRPLGELGLVLAVYTAGYLLSTVANGRLIRRFELGWMLVASSAAAALALGMYAAAGTWLLLVAAAALLGAAGGLIDAGMNAHAALHHGSRAINLLHASFGLGATLGPLVMTFMLAAAGSWRAGYAILSVVQAGLAMEFWRTRRRWVVADGSHRRPEPAPGRPILVLSLIVFFVYTGVEVAAGQWAYTLLTESRDFAPVLAGLLVTGYWGSFTAGRLAVAGLGDGAQPERLVRAGMLAALVGVTLLWWNPLDWIGAAGLLIVGFSLAPIFPLLTLLTPGRLGAAFTPTAIGYQLAAASLGAAAIPGAIGVSVNRYGLESIGPALVVAAVALVLGGAALTLGAQEPV